MLIAAAKLTLRAPWVRSLKEKRMIVQSLIARVSQKFHVSAAEVEQQDVHQTIVVGVAAVVGSAALGDAVLDKILRFVEETCEAELTGVEPGDPIRKGPRPSGTAGQGEKPAVPGRGCGPSLCGFRYSFRFNGRRKWAWTSRWPRGAAHRWYSARKRKPGARSRSRGFRGPRREPPPSLHSGAVQLLFRRVPRTPGRGRKLRSSRSSNSICSRALPEGARHRGCGSTGRSRGCSRVRSQEAGRWRIRDQNTSLSPPTVQAMRTSPGEFRPLAHFAPIGYNSQKRKDVPR